MLYGKSLWLIYFMYSSLLIPYPKLVPPNPLVTTSLFSMSVSLSPFCFLTIYWVAPSQWWACGIFAVACWIFSCSIEDLVPWPGIEPRPSALGAWSLSHWITREVPSLNLFCIYTYLYYFLDSTFKWYCIEFAFLWHFTKHNIL